MSRNTLLWILAVIITLASAVYQRLTGPTHPARGKITLSETVVSYKLPRAHIIGEPAVIRVTAASAQTTGKLVYRRHNSNDNWTYADLEKGDGHLSGVIPEQPSGGKMQYYIELSDQTATQRIPPTHFIISRFRDAVPPWALIPHIIFMFMAMLLSTRTGLEALQKKSSLKIWTDWTLLAVFVGGMIFGPLVQKYAFDAYWTGFPLGHDLTDTKTLVALAAWIIAAVHIRKKPQARGWVVAAAIVTLLAFAIPHSALGTELNYS